MSNRIRELREEARMTQVRLSIELEVSQETISAYESGKHYPSVASLLKLSQIFHASCDYILGISDIRMPAQNSLPDGAEQNIAMRWNRLNAGQRALALAYMDGLLDMGQTEQASRT
ncbi:MAG TPA: helix-turn-helix domain-containing protein [Candidatus Eisenbergiella merdavium]|uniref:Helix-turn-helix domain-containing protein n=1 Tax=Candidatus Eisenbergiella merdavium TaxID=2838551 RepID=A0A9D2SRE5_9FIRM|nr:helix-turn-helix domain-containing protein [Candidatus Eisenbergiella merdavium]